MEYSVFGFVHIVNAVSKWSVDQAQMLLMRSPCTCTKRRCSRYVWMFCTDGQWIWQTSKTDLERERERERVRIWMERKSGERVWVSKPESDEHLITMFCIKSTAKGIVKFIIGMQLSKTLWLGLYSRIIYLIHKHTHGPWSGVGLSWPRSPAPVGWWRVVRLRHGRCVVCVDTCVAKNREIKSKQGKWKKYKENDNGLHIKRFILRTCAVHLRYVCYTRMPKTDSKNRFSLRTITTLLCRMVSVSKCLSA